MLGFDVGCGGGANLRGLPTWNRDANIMKDIGIYRERVGVMLFFTITNVLNHFQRGNPGLSLTSSTSFGQITSQANTPRLWSLAYEFISKRNRRAGRGRLRQQAVRHYQEDIDEMFSGGKSNRYVFGAPQARLRRRIKRWVKN